ATTILGFDESTRTLTCASGRGPAQERQRTYTVEEFGSAWEQLCRDEPVVIREILWVPLVVRGRMTGLLSITSRAPDAYSARETSLALAIARQAAVALENARLHE